MTRQTFSFNWNFIVFFAVFTLASVTSATAQTETIIHTFRSSSQADGVSPYSALVPAANGALYGTTIQGGKYGRGGTVYKLAPPAAQGGSWKQNILYSFTGADDGSGPMGSVFVDPNSGKIYGTTFAGGSDDYGVVFELAPPTKAGGTWTESVLYAFTGLADGGHPQNGLISDGKGKLYGTTYLGGRYQSGTVFRLSPQPSGAWTESVLYSFGVDSDGGSPQPGGLSLAAGILYGTTQYGGAGAGTVFELSQPSGGGPWTQSILYDFTAIGDGSQPLGSLVFDNAGALYGATLGGGSVGLGTIYQLLPPAGQGGAWTENVLYSFTSTTDGYNPIAGVIFDSTGALDGVTESGGEAFCNSPWGCGGAFRLSPPSVPNGAWTFTSLHTFSGGADGSIPQAALLSYGGNLYGTTYQGGQSDCQQFSIGGCGTLFEIVP